MAGFLVLVLLGVAAVSASVSPKDILLTTTGYKYEKAYAVPSSGRLEFTVKTLRDAHIVFVVNAADISNTGKKSNIEVVLGMLTNTQSDIRAGHNGEELGNEATEGIVSGSEYRGFWIQITADNKVQVGQAGFTTPFMTGQAPPTKLPYFALSSFDGVSADWVVKDV